MSGHLFLGGPAHLQAHHLPYDTPRHWDFAVAPEPLLACWLEDEEMLSDPLEVERFTYVPMKVRVPEWDKTIHIYVPAEMSRDHRWALWELHVLGQIPEG